MSEPFSVASGAVGFISLGIQVTQGLITYLQDWKSRDSDVASTILSLQDLEQTLEHLSSVLGGNNVLRANAALSQHIEHLVQRVKLGIDTLQEVLSKFRRATPQATTSNRMKATLWSLKYPFKKDSLQFLNDIVRDLRLNVAVALQVLNLDTTAKTTQALIDMKNAALNTSAQISRLELTISQASSYPGSTALTLKNSQSEAETVASIETLGRAIVYKPELHQMLCDESRRLEGLMEMKKGDSQFDNSGRPKCRCQQYSRKVAQRYSIGPLRFFQAAVMSAMHYPTLDLAFHSTRGAGGRALGMYVKYTTTVPRRHPDFAEYEKLSDSMARLVQLFRSSEASPGDVNPAGRTVAHELLYKSRDYTDHSIQIRTIISLKGMGVPVNEVDVSGKSTLDILFGALRHCGIEEQRSILEYLINSGFELCHWCPQSSLEVIPIGDIVILGVKDCHLIYFDGGHLFSAIADKDVRTLEQLLIRKPSIIHEKDNKGHTAIHASVNWVHGMIVLFEHGGKSLINEPDMYDFIPLSYAIHMRSVEVARLLMDNGSSLSSPAWVNEGPFWCLHHVDEAIFHADESLLDSVLDALILRRHGLAELAKRFIPVIDLHENLVPLNGLPDRTAHAIQDILLKDGVELHKGFVVASFDTSIYDFEYLLPRDAHKAFEAGFRDIDSARNDGMSSFMCQCLFRNHLMVDWLLSKGANLERRVPDYGCMKSLTAMHLFARLITEASPEDILEQSWLPVLRDEWEGVPTFLDGARRALLSQSCDGCRCACSANGCLPRTNIFNNIASDNRRLEGSEGPRLQVLGEWIENTLDATEGLRTEVIEDLVRALTFDKLGMRHTCCHPAFHPYLWQVKYRNPLSDGEIEEIQDEEWALVKELESVVRDTSTTYSGFRAPIFEFLEQYWKQRMVQSLEKLKHDDDVDACARVGVVLEPDDSDQIVRVCDCS
ncbi:MAG: hypothetical protein M1822_007414 [Bathelium mastoideum]|nr:MAG: hypothetical protein M1822_007414 [Bathelium mastoideum]